MVLYEFEIVVVSNEMFEQSLPKQILNQGNFAQFRVVLTWTRFNQILENLIYLISSVRKLLKCYLCNTFSFREIFQENFRLIKCR